MPPAGPPAAGGSPIAASRPAANLEAGLLAHLALARLPGRFAVRLHDAARGIVQPLFGRSA